MSHKNLVLLLVLLAGLGGCGSTAKAPQTIKKDTDGCVAGAVKNTEGGFCLALPPAWKAAAPVQADAKTRDYGFDDGAGHGVNVDVSQLDDIYTWDVVVKGYQQQQTDADRSKQESGDIPGGGKFWKYFADGRLQLDVLTHKGNTLLTCKPFGGDVDQARTDACKSIRPL